MAYLNGKSGSFEIAGDPFSGRITWSETYDIETNTSVVSIDKVEVKSSNWYGVVYYPGGSIAINGQTVGTLHAGTPTHNVSIPRQNTYYQLATNTGGVPFPWYTSVTHDESGSKTVTVSVDIGLYTIDGKYGHGSKFTGSVALQLTDIPRRSLLTVGAGTLGEAQALTVKRYYEGFTHTVRCALGSATETICERDTATSYSWTPPPELAYQLPNATRGTATYTIQTYNGDTLVGTQTVTAELAVPAHIVPTVSATWTDTSGAKDKMGTLVKLVSTLAVDAKGVGVYGSTITGASMTLGGKPYTGGAILDGGDLTLLVTVSDSRGRSGSAAYTLSVADYAVPGLTLSASRCLADGTADDMGEYASITVTGTVSTLTGNTATLEVTYGGTSITQDFEPGNVSWSQIVPAPSVSTLAIRATLSDALKSTTRSMVLSVGYATLDFLAGGKGIAMGTTAKEEGFHCAMPAVFTGGLGGCIADYVVERGTGYEKWNSGKAVLWGTGTINGEGYYQTALPFGLGEPRYVLTAPHYTGSTSTIRTASIYTTTAGTCSATALTIYARSNGDVVEGLGIDYLIISRWK